MNPADATARATPSEPSARRAGGRRRPARPIALALFVCAAFAARFCIHPLGETDAGWHIALGRLILAGRFPRTNTLSWTAPDFPWYPTSWLFDVLSALAIRGGVLGLELLVAALFLAVLAGVAIACARASGAAWTAWLAPATFFTLLKLAVPRPHMASLAALALVLALCVRARGSPSPPPIARRLLALLLVALAGNLHAGAAFAAFALGCFALEAAWHERRAGRAIWREVAIFAAAPLALALNPGGLFNFGYLVDHLHVEETVALVEFLRPTLVGDPAFFAILIPCALIALLRCRSSPALSAIALVFALLGLRTQRLTQLLLVAGPVLLAPELRLLLTRLPRTIPRQRAAVLWMTLIVGLAALSADAGRRLEFPYSAVWNAQTLPVRAADFLTEYKIEGRGFNSLADGGYLAYARPSVPTFADGRLQAFPAPFFPSWSAAEPHNETFRAWLATFGVEWALTTRLKEKLGGYRSLNAPQWALVYWDELSEVWLRRDVPRFAGLIAQDEYRTFRPYGNLLGSIAALDRAGLRQLDAEVARFLVTAPGEPFSQVAICASAIRQQREGADAFCEHVVELAREANRPEIGALAAKARTLPPALR